MSVITVITEKLQWLLWDKINPDLLPKTELCIRRDALKEHEDTLINILVNPPRDVREGDIERLLETVEKELSHYESYIEKHAVKDDNISDVRPEKRLRTLEELNLDPIFVAEKLFEVQEQLMNNSKDFNKLVEIRKNLLDTRETIKKNLGGTAPKTVNSSTEELVNTLESVNMILFEVEAEIGKVTQEDPDRDYKLANLYQDAEYAENPKNSQKTQSQQSEQSLNKWKSYALEAQEEKNKNNIQQIPYYSSLQSVSIEKIIKRMEKWKETIPEIVVPTKESVMELYKSDKLVWDMDLAAISRQKDEYEATRECMVAYIKHKSNVIFYSRILTKDHSYVCKEINISVIALIWAGVGSIFQLESLKEYINKSHYGKVSSYKMNIFYKLAYEIMVDNI